MGKSGKRKKKTVSLTPQELQFCSNYCALGEKSFGQKGLSADLAGFNTPRNAATRLLAKPEIQQQIELLMSEHLERNRLTANGVIADICHDRTLARQRGDISTAVRCDELLGKYLRLWADIRFAVDYGQDEIDEVKRVEAAQLAEQRLIQGIVGETPDDDFDMPVGVLDDEDVSNDPPSGIIDTTFESDSSDSEPVFNEVS